MLVYGSDLAGDPVLEAALAGRESVIYFGTHANATTRAATLVIPTSTWAEKDGLFVTGKGRIQSFRCAVAPPGEVPEDWRLLAGLLEWFPGVEVPRDRAALRRLVAVELGLPAGTDLDNLPAAGLHFDVGVPEPAGGER